LARVAFLTDSRHPELTADDRLLREALEQLGATVSPVVWSQASAGWREFDAALIRSTWDYHHRLGPFLETLGRLEDAGVRLFNPASVVRWNADKRYLLGLGAAGVPIPATALVRKGERPDLAALLRATGWARAVIKPAVSASAHETWSVEPEAASERQSDLERLSAAGDVLVQEFRPEVTDPGEWSLVFVQGVLSHALLKTARPGDFRVQEEHGGRIEARTPEAALAAAAGHALAVAARCLELREPLLYARVDGVVAGDRFLLMELELIEPALYLGLEPGSEARLASALLRRLRATAP
jgi:glutathione synthase/RimK-type ligase-like ATP-grasp enzyme